MTRSTLFIVITLALMVLALGTPPDRSVGLATSLLRNGGLYNLSEVEKTVLSHALTEMISDSPNPAFSINAPHESTRLNVYVVDVPDNPTSAWSHGNAAYAARSDTLFIDATYLRHGDHRVLDVSADELVNKVLAPLRFGAFFALAHELGHRQQQHENRWHRFFVPSKERERRADLIALQTMQRLYQVDDLLDAGVVAPPTSELASMLSENPTPLQHVADHLSYSVSFLTNDIFDGPFPILSESASHPQYVARLIALLDLVESQAKDASDEDAHRSIQRARSTVLPALTLLRWQPTEIVFDHPFQFAYLTDSHIHVLESEGKPVRRIALDTLLPGQLMRVENEVPTGNATVRYAWGAADGSVIEITRDGHLKQKDVNTGKALNSLPVQFGDNTCARRFVQPIGVGALAYVQYCEQRMPYVAVISGPESIQTHALQSIANKASNTDSTEAAQVVSFSMDAAGRPVLYLAQGTRITAARLTTTMSIETVKSLQIPSDWLPSSLTENGLSIDRKLLFDDAQGRSFFLENAGLFRQVVVRDATTQGMPTAFTHSSTPQIDNPAFMDIGVIRETHSLGDGRVIVNLEQYGVYLIDFPQTVVVPLARESYSAQEQVTVNTHGAWILFRKFGHRIIYFRHKE